MKLSLSRCDDDRVTWLDSDVSQKLSRVVEATGESEMTVALIVVDDEHMRLLNRKYRGQDRPTDVLSFSYLSDIEESPADDDLAGEIYVSFETLEEEAKESGVEAKHLFLRMGVHGLLHVLGYDHETEAEARTMEAEEKRLLLELLKPSQVEVLF